MENISKITDEDIVTNQQTKHPKGFKKPEDIEEYYSEALLREQSGNPKVLLKIWKNYWQWMDKEYKGADKLEKLAKMNHDMTKSLKDAEEVFQDKALVLIWTKYAQQVSAIFEVYKYMEENGIGKNTYIFYWEYSRNVETLTRDFKKADKILRTGLKNVEDRRGQEKMNEIYEKFTQRMEDRIKRLEDEEIKDTRLVRKRLPVASKKDSTPLIERLISKNNKDENQSDTFLNVPKGPTPTRQKYSYTLEGFANPGGCPVYIDSPERDKLIPKGARAVCKYYNELDMLNKDYEITQES